MKDPCAQVLILSASMTERTLPLVEAEIVVDGLDRCQFWDKRFPHQKLLQYYKIRMLNTPLLLRKYSLIRSEFF